MIHGLTEIATEMVLQAPSISVDLASRTVDWIEQHDKTVDLLKWIAAALLAWLLGLVRFVRTKLKRPTVEIEMFTSRCVVDDLGEMEGRASNIRAIFLLEPGLNNPTTDPIVVREFTIAMKALRRWPIWQRQMHPTTLPSRPQHSAGQMTKLLKCWFSNFNDGSSDLTLSGRIESRDFQSGFLLFTSVTFGNLQPRISNERIPIKVRARLTTGETLTAKAMIRVVDDPFILERMVPGILEHTKTSSTWNIIRELR
ncbi:TPA: hypothetical protein UM220_001442 [Stenotrophomonas maltophilia]|nr:hypothetical protein [Stenotrophomonas maltophilia]